MSSAGFEPAIPASERPLTRALDRAATRIGLSYPCSPYGYEWLIPKSQREHETGENCVMRSFLVFIGLMLLRGGMKGNENWLNM